MFAFAAILPAFAFDFAAFAFSYSSSRCLTHVRLLLFFFRFINFSFVMCFTVPVGLGIYWIAGAVVRSVQQFFLNKHFEKINLEDIIKKNQEKAKKKREKMGNCIISRIDGIRQRRKCTL